MTETTDTKQALKEYVDTLGLIYLAIFQPTLQPAATVKNPQLHWLITLSKGTRSAQFPYFQGVAHVAEYRQSHRTRYDRAQAEERYRKACETGFVYVVKPGWSVPSKTIPQPAPDVLDVLYCLVSEADVLNTSSFEEWASELGYDTDSRQAEEIYKKCLQYALALKGLVGCQALEKLRELFQDY